jgi:hypothetical protein
MSLEALRSEIKGALRAGDMDRAWMWVSILIGKRIIAGEITVKLKKHRL